MAKKILTQQTADLDVIQALAEKPNINDGLTYTQLQAKFDEAANANKTYLNSTLIAELQASTDGASGAQAIGYDGSGVDNVADQLDAILSAGTGSIPPDGTVTEAKLATDAVTNTKVADNAIDTDNIVDGAVTNDKVASNAVNATNIVDGAVTNAKLGTGVVTEAKLGSGAVTEDKLGTGAVTENKLGAGSVTNAKLGSGAVTEAKVANGAISEAKLASDVQTKLGVVDKNLINILNLKLQQSLSSSDIDAWSDLLSDTSMLSNGSSQNYTLSSGSISPSNPLDDIVSGSNTIQWWRGGPYGVSPESLGQTITAPYEMGISGFSVYMRREGTGGTGTIQGHLYSTDANKKPDTLIASTSTILDKSAIDTSYAYTSFSFSSTQTLSAGTRYALILTATGSTEDDNDYIFINAGSDAFGDEVTVDNEGGSWDYLNNDDDGAASINMRVSIATELQADVLWNAVVPTEALANIAIVSDQTENSGTITWYASDDGSTWSEITPETMTSVSFTAEFVYVKCFLTADASISAVAWGGY